MRFDGKLIIAVIAILVQVPVTLCLEVGGGSSALAGAESTVQGSFLADNAQASSAMTTSGSIPHAGELRFVQDDSGKRAEILFDVIGAVGSVKYSATFSPKEGGVGKTVSTVSAGQTLTVPSAGVISVHTAAQSSPGSNVAVVNLTVAGTGDTSSASFSGSSKSQAGTLSTRSLMLGRAVGAICGTGYYGGSISGPYDSSKEMNSEGQKVDCNLFIQVDSASGTGSISGGSTFTVDAAADEKIQSAMSTAWDGDTISVAKGTYCENLALDKNLTLKGAGSAKTVLDGSLFDTVVTIGKTSKDARVSLSDVTIQNGSCMYGNGGGISNMGTVTLTGCKVTRNSASTGGGIYSIGTATITGCTISENYCSNHGGGALLNGNSTVSKSTFTGNTAFNGGAVANFNKGTATITGCTFSDNSATNGGAVFNAGNMDIASSTVSSNLAQSGGGIESSSGRLTATGCTITGNTASSGGGVESRGKTTLTKCTVSKNYAANGGGINSGSVLDLISSTVSGNVGGSGGGISSFGTLNVSASTVSSNTATLGGGIYGAGTMNVASSTISGNTAATSGGGIYNMGTLTVSGSSQITGNKAALWSGGGIYSTKPTVTLDGTKASIKTNKAHQPLTPDLWYQGWGVYLEDGIPSTTGGFNPAKQVTGNTRA